MRISDLISTSKVHMSCEIFPPKVFDKVEEAKSVVSEICKLHPAYVSVTYGATGKTPHFTQEMSECIQDCGVVALNHLTCINDTKSKVQEVLDKLKAVGVNNILALRGDLPEGVEFPGEDHFRYAAELIEAIKLRGDFCVGAACYPEGHPEAPSRDQDLTFLRMKQDAGADFLTTQMFFDNNIMYQFMYRALQKGITIPVTAGIMPVTNANQIRRIASLSSASMPQRFLSILDRFGSDSESMKKAGIAYATDQIIDLIANGVNHIHLYTMNKPDIAKAIFDNLGCILDTSYE